MPDKVTDSITNLIAALSAIDGTGDYNLDLTDKVFNQRTQPFNASEIPALNIVERNIDELDELLSGGSGIDESIMIVDIDLITNSATDARLGLVDINRKIGEDTTLGGVADNIKRAGVVWNYDKQNEYKIQGLTRSIAINFRTSKWLGT